MVNKKYLSVTNYRDLNNNLSYIYLGYFVCVSVIHNCGTLCYSFSFNKQTDEKRRDGGFGQGGIEIER
jgi:hypothetical protein